MDENKVKTDEPKVFLTRGDDGKLKAIAGEQDDKLITDVLKHLKSVGIIIAGMILLQLLTLMGVILPYDTYSSGFSTATILTGLILHLLLLYYLLRKELHSPLPVPKETVFPTETSKTVYAIEVDIQQQSVPNIIASNVPKPDASPTKKLNRKDFERFIRSRKPYLDPNYKIMDMVEQLNVSRVYVSRFINGTYGVNSNVYINHCRLAELERLRKLTDNKRKKTADLILLAGFPNYRSL